MARPMRAEGGPLGPGPFGPPCTQRCIHRRVQSHATMIIAYQVLSWPQIQMNLYMFLTCYVWCWIPETIGRRDMAISQVLSQHDCWFQGRTGGVCVGICVLLRIVAAAECRRLPRINILSAEAKTTICIRRSFWVYWRIGPDLYIWMYIYIYMLMYMFMYICIDMQVYVYIYMYMCTCIYTHIHIHMHVHIYIYTDILIHSYTYIYTCI